MTAPLGVDILAPLSGVIVPLDSVPDPVFARKMVGDGVAIDPTSGEVLAPVAGAVTQFHAAHHALAITSDQGVEVLVHVGLDTVTLAGVGFTPAVSLGDRVEAGQVVLRFDPETVARTARSLLTAVIVTNGERVASLRPAHGLAVAGKTVLLRLELAGSGAAAEAEGETVRSEPVEVANELGLHARPAAVLAGEAKRFAAAVQLQRGSDTVNAKSVVAIMGLSTRKGEKVRFEATGVDARAAVLRLVEVVAEGCGEVSSEALKEQAPPPRGVPELRLVSTTPGELTGVPASPGLAVGRVFQHRHAAIKVQQAGEGPDQERARFAAAVREAARQVDALRRHVADGSKGQILGVQIALLEDPDLIDITEALLREGKSAAFAWREAYTRHAARLEQLESPLMRERAADLRDIGSRLLALLAGITQTQVEVPEGSILIADELTPSETAEFDRSRIVGFCTTTGGSTSHVAILARSLGIPALCGIDEAALQLPNGERVVVDGTLGSLRVGPDENQVKQVRQRIASQAAQHEADAAAAVGPGRTRDGHVEVVANIRNLEDAREAIAQGAEGVGLMRSEFLFFGREAAPGEDEQAAAYTAIAEVLGKERRFVLRTLDVGGDKPLPYLPLPPEQNPFLGMRGIRVSLAHPELFRTQLRAVLRSAPAGNLHLMFPMISSLEELRAAKQFLAEEQQTIQRAVKVGVMIEVPSAAVTVELLAREVDFFSIGTNDLTQYTLATDRGHPKLARFADALHPAVLRLVAMTVEGAHEHGKWVGVCGGLASDPLAVPLLVGLGVDELSVSVPAIVPVKATLSRWRFHECAGLATDVLRCRTTAEVRTMLTQQVEEAAAVATARVSS
jgi:phosphoenolpyruvate-protein phosphotransferase